MDEPSETRTLAESESGNALFARRYRVRSLLGRGASKEVYLAYDERLDREVALALIVGGHGERAGARVRREARVTGRLGDHPNIVTAYDAGEHDGVSYLVLRLMAGGSLAGRLREGPLPVDAALRIGQQIATALAHVHEHGIVHRDVKPDNVWLTAGGDAALGDFGVAHVSDEERLTVDGAVVGTARYLSPEQARGDPVEAPSDLYALGVTLYELLTGRPPYTGDLAGLLVQHLSGTPEPPSRHQPAIPSSLEQLVLDLLAKRPDERPPSARAVAEALAALPVAERAVDGGFVGRDAVMASLDGALGRAVTGSARIVALTGEPGIGKTRCVEELERRAAGFGVTVVWGRCAEHEGVPAFWPWKRALRGLGGEGPLERGHEPQGGDEEARFRLFDAIAEHLRRVTAERPAVVALEDLHWADRSSLELLAHVAREVGHARLMLVLTYREGDVRAGHPLQRALAELARERIYQRLDLDGLSHDEVARVAAAAGADSVDAVAAAIHERTDGNPFFVGELVRLLREDGAADTAAIPSAVRDVVSTRLDRIEGSDRALLDAAAVAGRDAPLALVARVAGLSRVDALDAVEVAAGAHLLHRDPPARCRFVHAIVRDVLYEGLPTGRRAHLHRALGELLEERRLRGEPELAAEVAHHRLAAARAGAEPEPAVEASLEAAREATARLAFGEAAEHFEGALEGASLADEVDDAARGHLLLEVAGARATAGDLEDARRRYAEAAGVARRLGDPDSLAQAALGFAEWQMYGVVDDDAIALLREALERLPERDGVLRAGLLARLAVRLDPQREQPTREALIDEAIAMARRLPERATLARLLALSTLVHRRPESVARRSADAAETIALARHGGDREAMLWAHTVRYADAFETGEMTAADAELAAFAELAADLRRPYYRWWLSVLRAARTIFAGRLDDGAEQAADAVALNRAHDLDAEQEYVVQRFMLASAGGRSADADPAALRGFAERYPKLPMWQSIAACAELVAGEAGHARQRFERLAAGGFTELADRDPDAVATLAFAAETCAGLDDAPRAAVLHELLLPYRDRNVIVDRGWAAWGAAAHQLGLLAVTLGDEALAAEHFARAAELNRRWGARPWLLRSLLAAHRAGCLGEPGRRELRDLGAALSIPVI